MKQLQHITITQDGPMVHVQGNVLRITSAGTATYSKYYARDDKYGHVVPTESQADLVDTTTWRLQGSMLICEATFNYKRQYYQHQPGTDLRVVKYRRVSP